MVTRKLSLRATLPIVDLALSVIVVCVTLNRQIIQRDTVGRVSFIKAKAKSYTEWMRLRVDSIKGREIYAHRMHVVEPVFGNIESNKGLGRFSLRGKQKVEGQWLLFTI